MMMSGRIVRIVVRSRNGFWKRGVGAATFTARDIGIVRWGRGLGRRTANARRYERQSSMYLPIKKRWGGKRVRTVGLARARIKIGMMNLAYNLRRLAWLRMHRRLIGRIL